MDVFLSITKNNFSKPKGAEEGEHNTMAMTLNKIKGFPTLITERAA